MTVTYDEKGRPQQSAPSGTVSINPQQPYDPNSTAVGGTPQASSMSTTRFAWLPENTVTQGAVKRVGDERIPINLGEFTTGGGATDSDEAIGQIYLWSPEQLAAFRDDAIRYGYMTADDASFTNLRSLWTRLVDESANYYTASNGQKKLTPADIMAMRAGENPEGGAGGAKIQKLGETSARGALEGAMGSELGRTIASPGAVSAFQGDANAQYRASQTGDRTFDAGTAATEYVREQHGSEAGSRGALHYYDLIAGAAGGGRA